MPASERLIVSSNGAPCTQKHANDRQKLWVGQGRNSYTRHAFRVTPQGENYTATTYLENKTNRAPRGSVLLEAFKVAAKIGRCPGRLGVALRKGDTQGGRGAMNERRGEAESSDK